MKKYYSAIIYILVIIFLIFCIWFWFSPYAVKSSLRIPRNYDECVKAGGKSSERSISESVQNWPYCNYNGSEYHWGDNIRPNLN